MAQSLNRTLFISDNLPILRGIDSESIDLIATDPPFNKGVKAFEGITAAGENVSYSDVWTWGDVQVAWTNKILVDHPALYNVIQAANSAAGDDMGAFLCWLGVRVLEMHRVLKPTGSLYLHCDHTAHAWVKAMMDAIVGRKNFRNEVVWKRSMGAKNNAKRFHSEHDTLLCYSKSSTRTWNPPFRPLDPEVVDRWYRWTDEDGRRYNVADLQAPLGGGYRYEFLGAVRGWRYPKQRMEQLLADGLIVHKSVTPGSRRKIAGRKRFLDESKGALLGDIWMDIDMLQRSSKERTGYPTQKPLALYERIIGASSNPGDIVLDPFAGCATTCVAAERLGREWVGIDLNEPARHIIFDRLQREVSESMSWKTLVGTPTEPPERTDGGEAVAPELVVVSRKRNAPRVSVRVLREKLLLRDGKRCQGCGWEPPYPDYLEVDHKKPRSLEGSDDLDNRTLLCNPCNRLKSNKLTLTELRQEREGEGRMDKMWWKDERWL